MTLLSRPAAALMSLGLLVGCPDRNPGLLDIPPGKQASDVEPPMGMDGGLIGSLELRVLSVDPGHGPFTGGTTAVVRGAGFDAEGELDVRFGGASVNPVALERADATRIRVLVPAGTPGPADVEVQIGDTIATLADGYLYDQIFVEPNRGSTGGGTFVTITGTETDFTEGDEVYFGDWPCTGVEIVSDSEIGCRTPANAVGPADVSVRRAGDTTFMVEDGFTYYDTSDPSGGGLGGGPSEGTLNVTVIDIDSGEGVEDALVFLGDEVDGDFQGYSDLFGRITFSGPQIVPPLTVHVAKDCYESSSFVTFDAQDVTAFVTNLCPPDGNGMPPEGRAPPEQYVEGELVWTGPNEYGPNPWSNVPEAREGWVRVAYVYETRPCAEDTRRCSNPDPGLGMTTQRVLESPTGELGYPYRIFSRTGGLAVYALAGLENRETDEFIPYVMGIARGVLVGPGDTVTGQNMLMNIPLDHYLDVRLEGAPEEPDDLDGRYFVRADIDLAGEGVIVRRHAGEWLDRIDSPTTERDFRFTAQPALTGALSNGRYRIDAFWEVPEEDSLISHGGRPTPRWHSIRRGVRAVDTTVVLDTFHSIPTPTAPAPGGTIPADRILRWDATGAAPTFYRVQLFGLDPATGMLQPLWSLFVNGEQNFARIPNVDPIDGLADPARQARLMQIHAITVPSLRFSDVSYADMAEGRHRAWALRFDWVNGSGL